jgi:RNase H-like domain found in reverse transcriptase
VQFPSNLSSYDGQYFHDDDWQMTSHCLYGWHTHLCQHRRRTEKDNKTSTGKPTRTQPLPESQEMWILQNQNQISRHDHWTRKDCYGLGQIRRNQNVFDTLKKRFTEEPVSLMPNQSKLFQIKSDASKVASGTVLTQLNSDGDWHPIAFMSKTFSETERKYRIYDWELLGIIQTLK